jgi:hypothetical protein
MEGLDTQISGSCNSYPKAFEHISQRQMNGRVNPGVSNDSTPVSACTPMDDCLLFRLCLLTVTLLRIQ